MQNAPHSSLADLVEQAESQMLEDLGFSSRTVASHQYFWRKILRFATDIAGEDVMSKELARRYVEHLGYDLDNLPSPMPLMLRKTLTSLRVLLDVHYEGHVSEDRIRADHLPISRSPFARTAPRRRRESRVIKRLESLPELFRAPAELHIAHCRELGHAECGLAGILSIVPRFCQFLIGIGLSAPSEVKPAHITDYVLSLSRLSHRTIHTYCTRVRCFLRFLYLRQIIDSDLTSCVPSPRVSSYGKIPSVWTQDEVERLLAQVDRGSPRGKRDYAILLLAARTGMRVGDIIRLEFSNINWEQKQIEIVQSKTKTPLTIPLREDVGWALIDYIRSARPQSRHNTVFLSLSSPYSPFVTKDNLYHIIAKYRRRAGIHRYARQSGGIHTLRHSLASNLLAHDTPLPTISNVLGHSHHSSTSYYIKVDIAHLRECAIDPDEVNNED